MADTSDAMRVLTGRKRDRRILQGMLLLMGAIWLFPIYAAIKRSLEGGGTSNYTALFTDPVGDVTIYDTYLNSFIIAVLHAGIVVGVGALAGYAFSKLHFRGKEALYYGIVLCLAVPGTAILVPLYYTIREAGLFDNYLGVALPEAALTLPFAVLLLRNFGDNIPDSLIEAARMDRAGHWQVFRTVYLPLCRPALVNLSILCFMWSLQDFLFPSLFFTDEKYTTAAKAVQSFQQYLATSPSDIGKYNASLVLLAVPALLLVVFGLRFITAGLTSGGVKE